MHISSSIRVRSVFGSGLGQFQHSFGTVLGHAYIELGQVWICFWVRFGPVLTQFWAEFGFKIVSEGSPTVHTAQMYRVCPWCIQRVFLPTLESKET